MKKKLKANPRPRRAQEPTPETSLPTDLSVDDWGNWNFEAVPADEHELKTCCFWEYARESAFIRSVRQRCRQMAGRGLDREQRHEWVGADFRKIRSALGRSAHLFQERIYGLGGTTHYEEAVSPFPQPWQSLGKAMRCILLETAAWTRNMVMEIPAFRWSHFARAVALAKRHEALHPPRSEPVRKAEFRAWLQDKSNWEPYDRFLWGDKPRAERPSFMYAGGTEMLLVEIEWGRFTNEQIIDCFRKWVRAHRPKDVKAPSSRGHDSLDWRASLERLGLLRLRSRYTFDHAKPFLKELPQTTKTTNAGECNREAAKAIDDFHRFFSFLDPAEMPLSWPMK